VVCTLQLTERKDYIQERRGDGRSGVQRGVEQSRVGRRLGKKEDERIAGWLEW
jgi:hypothetical protein